MNRDKLNNVRWQPGFVEHRYYDGYVEDIDTEQELVDVIYIMQDVHYYLNEWHPKNQKKHDCYFAVGCNFHSIPGEYLLPFGEGWYRLDGDGRITMRPRGTN